MAGAAAFAGLTTPSLVRVSVDAMSRPARPRIKKEHGRGKMSIAFSRAFEAEFLTENKTSVSELQRIFIGLS